MEVILMPVNQIVNDNLNRKDREFRFISDFEVRAAQIDTEESGQELYVEGYAVVFNNPTVLWEYDGVQYKEQIDRNAFTEADMSDVIFNYDHGGKVMARTRNKTLDLRLDDKGLYIRARLDGTEEGQELYNEIRGGYVDRMSFSFTTQESSYDSDAHMRTILKVKKLYDVAAVSIPAYDSTSISARSFFEAQEELQQEKLKEVRKKQLILKTFF